MATTIDHLSANHMVLVLEEFVDARSVRHKAGEEGQIIALGFDMHTNDISIEWQRDGKAETMVFDLRERSGPGNGRMRQCFELGEYVDPGRGDRARERDPQDREGVPGPRTCTSSMNLHAESGTPEKE